MPRRPVRRKRVSFVATKKVARPVTVSFRTRSGKRIRFTGTRKVSVPFRVTFYKKRRK